MYESQTERAMLRLLASEPLSKHDILFQLGIIIADTQVPAEVRNSLTQSHVIISEIPDSVFLGNDGSSSSEQLLDALDIISVALLSYKAVNDKDLLDRQWNEQCKAMINNLPNFDE